MNRFHVIYQKALIASTATAPAPWTQISQGLVELSVEEEVEGVDLSVE